MIIFCYAVGQPEVNQPTLGGCVTVSPWEDVQAARVVCMDKIRGAPDIFAVSTPLGDAFIIASRSWDAKRMMIVQRGENKIDSIESLLQAGCSWM